MSEITIDTFTPIIGALLRPPLFLVEKKDRAEQVTVEIRQPQAKVGSGLLQSISDLFQEQATDEVREVLTMQLIQLAEHTIHHSDHLLTVCLTKESNENRHHAHAYAEGKEVFHQIITPDEDVMPFINRMDQLIRKLESD